MHTLVVHRIDVGLLLRLSMRSRFLPLWENRVSKVRHVTMCWGLSGWVEVEVEVEVAVEVGIRSIPAWRTALDAAGPYVSGNKTLA